MNKMINYSVVIPFRNSMDQLKDALKSIPDRGDIQIIVVDNSKELFKEEQYPKYNHAQLIIKSSKYGAGAGCARNVGLKYIEGKWTLFLDADDKFSRDAFSSFDKYLEQDFDIVYFKADSVNLVSGLESRRHKGINDRIDRYLSSKNEDYLRYQFSSPVCKMIRSALIKNNNIIFEEVKCSNDVMFSVQSGHLASSVAADTTSVYVITESPRGGSLTSDKSAENSFIRFQVVTRKYAYLKSVGKGYIKPRFSSYILNALLKFGPIEAFKYISFYRNNRP